MIMAHANETGGKVIFTESVYGEDISGGFGRILSSEIRTNAAILSAILAMEEGNAQVMSTDTAYKIVRFITQSRKSRDHWENTQENAFCMNALTAFSRAYDREAIHYTIAASMDEKGFGRAVFDDLRDEPAEFVRPIENKDPGRKTDVTLWKSGAGRVY